MTKILSLIIITTVILSCNNSSEKKQQLESNSTPIIGERINGPANVYDKPNGDIIFSIDDNYLINVQPEKNGWLELIIYSEVPTVESAFESIEKNKPIIVNNQTIGKVLKTHSSYGQMSDEEKDYVMFHGYIKDTDIKQYSIIENILLNNLESNDPSLNYWNPFITSFSLKENAIDYDGFETFYNYEKDIHNFSSKFRIVLLFKNKQLIGLIHSRELNLTKMKTYELDWSYKISFFNTYSKDKQQKFVDYMNLWLRGDK